MSDIFISVLVGYGVAVDLSFLFVFHFSRPTYTPAEI